MGIITDTAATVFRDRVSAGGALWNPVKSEIRAWGAMIDTLKLDVALRGAANGVAPLGPDGLVPGSFLPASGSYKGTWNANTNTPTITSGAATNGDFYIVSTAGTTNIDGVATWAVGDQIRNNGTVWQKVPTNAAVSSVAGKTGAVTLAIADITSLQTALDARIASAGGTFTGDVTFNTKSIFARGQTIQEPTQNKPNDYGMVTAGNTRLCISEGTVTTPITNEAWNRPMVYMERHVAGRMSQEPTGLIDANLDSNWLLAPTMLVQTVIGTNGSNANAGIHSRVVSDTAIGTTPTYTGPGTAGFGQAGMEISVNCLCAYVGTVRVNAPSGQKARPAWVQNWECVWQTGLAPDNLVGVEIDMINTGGGASGPLPAAGNNFTGVWLQSAPRGTSGSVKKYATTGVYIADAGIAGMGWHAGLVMRTAIGSYGAYFENSSATDAPTGVFLSGRWNRGLQAVGNFDNNFLKQDSECGSYIADLRNSKTSAGAGGIKVVTNRASDDTTICEFLGPSGFAMYATGDATNPIRLRAGGAVRQVTTAEISGYTALVFV